MFSRKNPVFALLFLFLFLAGCEEQNPLEATRSDAVAQADIEGEEAAKSARNVKDKNFLKNVPVTGVLADGGTFKGKVTIKRFDYDEALGLTVSGFVHGTAITADGTEHENTEMWFSNIPATLIEDESAAGLKNGVGAQSHTDCQILFLDLGPLFLDLLGLQVDLSQITLDITAVSGAGNLLGNLLCAVAGLLDPLGFLNLLIGTLEDLLELLNLINDLIG